MEIRYYLAADGTERLATTQEASHYGIAKTELPKRGLPVPNADTAYGEMWRLGYVRMLDRGDRAYAEMYSGNGPVPFEKLTNAQRRYLLDLASKKPLFYNDAVFESTREGKADAGNYSILATEVVNALIA